MFYFEFILFFLIIILFVLHFQKEDLYSFFLYNTSPIFFGFLSLYSIQEITNERMIKDILFFIMNNDTGMGIFAALFLAIFLLCCILMCYNFYIIYEEKTITK